MNIVALATAATFVGFLLVERLCPLRKQRFRWIPRLLVNLALSGMTFAVAALLVRPSLRTMIPWTGENQFGLVHWAGLPPWGGFLAGVLLMDLGFYYWHIANHKIPLLWRFHNVHHYDPDLDVSTGFRFHFGEVVLSVVFRVVQVTVIGVSAWAFAIYELVFQINTLFHHSNVRLPIRIERWLNLVLVTPRMHGIHHSQIRDETNSNYSVVFSWWDRLHRTLGLNLAQSKVVIGVPGYSTENDNRFLNTVCSPFRKQREYWRRPDGNAIPTESRAKKGAQFLVE